MSDTVRIGVIGTGSISQRGILPHLTQDDMDTAEVSAVCDIVPGRAEETADKFGVPHAFEDYEEVLKSGEVDAVTLATPIGLHYEQGMQAIEHGVHVHFNKTFCTTLEEADDLIDTAERNGVELVASPGQMIRPHNQKIRSLVDDGSIGVPTWAVTGKSFGEYDYQGRDTVAVHLDNLETRHGDDVLSNIDPSWYFREPGGGPLYDVTIYGLHSITGILGPAKRVTSMSGVRIPEREFKGEVIETEADDNSFMLLDFGDSMTGFVYGAAWGNLPGVRGVYVCGTEGRINGSELNEEPIELPDDAHLPHVTGPHEDIGESHVFEDIMQLVDLVRDGTPTLASVEHARHVVEIIDKTYRSAETGQTLDLETTFDVDQDLMPYYGA